MYIPVWKVQQANCIAVMSAGRGIEESSVLEVSATEYIHVHVPELSPVHLQYVNETSRHCTHVYTCTCTNIIHTYHIQWYNVHNVYNSLHDTVT